jgi:hypothetical protein
MRRTLRVLLDENLPKRLLHLFAEDVEAWTVGQRGWKGIKNGELLAAAESEFDILVTMDKGIPHQKDLDRFDLLFILLQARSNAYPELASCMDEVNAVIFTATSTPETVKKVTRVSSERP